MLRCVVSPWVAFYRWELVRQCPGDQVPPRPFLLFSSLQGRGQTAGGLITGQQRHFYRVNPDKHTTNLIIDTLPSINRDKYTAIQQKPQHNLIPVTAQETKDIRPGSLLERHNILVRKPGHKAGYTARGSIVVPQGGKSGGTLVPMGQQVLGFPVQDAIAVE